MAFGRSACRCSIPLRFTIDSKTAPAVGVVREILERISPTIFRRKKMSNIAKITAAQGADEALDRMVKTANDGFSGGRVTKHDLTSWIITHFEEDYFQPCIHKIREDHFNRITYL